MSKPGKHRGELTTVNYAEIILRDAQAHKQLALSNVDLHVLGCMLKVGEYIPASSAFRRTLTKARQAQKNETWYIHKLIAIGSAENYVCDQLLKFRAGENVIVLMSATVPVMGEEGAIAVLFSLFDCIGAQDENVPGRQQLENFRTSLVAISRRSGFPERVAQYHSLFHRVLQGSDCQILPDPYTGLPDSVTMAKFIKHMHRVATEEAFLVIWKGVRGAAWAAAYSSMVLGLGACAVELDGTEVPIKAHMQTRV